MEESGKLSIARWAEKHKISVLVALTAQRLVLMADQAFAVLEGFRAGELEKHLPCRPPFREWLRLYRQHRQIRLTLADHGPTVLGFRSGEEVESGMNLANALARNVSGLREEFEAWWRKLSMEKQQRLAFRAVKRGRRWYRKHLREMKAYVRGDEEDGDDASTFWNTLTDVPELHFFSRVTLPCFAAYEVGPLDLLRRARGGDVGAIEDLLRLDDMAIHDPKVAAWVHGGGGSVSRARIGMAARWMEAGLAKPISGKTLKCSLAGLISRLSEVLGRRLSAKQILGLFDAAARDLEGTPGKWSVDSDLQGTSPDTFRKAIQRHRKLWQIEPVLGVDKKRSV